MTRTTRAHKANSGGRRNGALLTAAMLLATAGATSQASAQWTVINLHPAGARNSEARSIENGQQFGIANYAPGTGFDNHAILWTGSAASATSLNPTTYSGMGECIYAGAQFGMAEVYDESVGLPRHHAAMWTGSAGSFVDLHPPEVGATSSHVYTASDGVQGGSWSPQGDSGGGGIGLGFGHPCIWHGTAESFVDLTPVNGISTGEVRGIHGNQQVGAHFDFGFSMACMWTGTPESYVDLNPPGAFASMAQCTDGVHQYGAALFLDFVTGDASFQAGYWSGTAESWVDMTPAGTPGGAINAVDGSQQVGVIWGTPTGEGPNRAALWNGSAETYVDLHALLPSGYSESQALDIWHDAEGYAWIAGYAVNEATGENEAVMWIPARPGADLVTNLIGPTDCTAAPGMPMNYTVQVTNGGLDASGPATVTFNLPSEFAATYGSASPAPSSVTPTTVTFDLPSVAAGATHEITVTLTAVAAFDQIGASASVSAAGDYDTSNDIDDVMTWTLPVLPAGVYVETIDAPEVAAQAVPAGSLTAIEGRLKGDADLYEIKVDDWALFSATTTTSSHLASCNGAPNTLGYSNLFLFDANGVAIAFYQGDTFSSISGAELDLTNRVNGETIWLGISQYSYLPTSGGEGNFIWWLDPDHMVRTPDGPGAFGAVDGWEFADTSGSGTFFYRIDLTGASGVPSTPACPADLDDSGSVDVFDLLAYLDMWFAGDAGAELTGDTPANVDVFDLLAYLDGWFAGC